MDKLWVKNHFSFFLLLLPLVLLAACTPGEPVTELAAATNVQVFIFPGEPEKRLISDEKIVQNNCDGAAETSQTVTRQQTVQYTIEVGAGLTVSAEGKVGVQGIGEVGVGAEVATHYKVGYGRQETVSRAVTVATPPNAHIEHLIRQFEIWETGEVLVVAGNQNQRLPYSFRRDFSIEVVPPANIGCPGIANLISPSVPRPVSTTVPASESAPIIQPPQPTVGIPRQQINAWSVGWTSREEVIRIIEETQRFSGRTAFREGDTIPAGVLITSDLGIEWEQYPLRRLAHDGGGWGVFESLGSFVVLPAHDLDDAVGGQYWPISE